MNADLRRLYARDLATMIREVELMPDDRSLWAVVPGITNSVGTLGLHLAGNLQHFIGAVLGGTGYERDREREFTQREGTRDEVIAGLRRAAESVDRTLAGLAPEALEAPYPLPMAGATLGTRLVLMHLATHLAMHLGQAGYLRRAMQADPRTTSPSAVAGLTA